MILVSENGKKLLNPTKTQVFAELLKLDGVRISYISLEDDRENYIQVGGGPREFTVEVRIISSNGRFTHWKAELFNSKNNNIRSIIISGSKVQVKSNQVIELDMVSLLFESFIDGEYLSAIVKWTDMTEMFI